MKQKGALLLAALLSQLLLLVVFPAVEGCAPHAPARPGTDGDSGENQAPSPAHQSSSSSSESKSEEKEKNRTGGGGGGAGAAPGKSHGQNNNKNAAPAPSKHHISRPSPFSSSSSSSSSEEEHKKRQKPKRPVAPATSATSAPGFSTPSPPPATCTATNPTQSGRTAPLLWNRALFLNQGIAETQPADFSCACPSNTNGVSEFWYEPPRASAIPINILTNPLTCPLFCACDMVDQLCVDGSDPSIFVSLTVNCATSTNGICNWIIGVNGTIGQCVKPHNATGCTAAAGSPVIPVGDIFPFPGDLGIYITCGGCPSQAQLTALQQCYLGSLLPSVSVPSNPFSLTCSPKNPTAPGRTVPLLWNRAQLQGAGQITQTVPAAEATCNCPASLGGVTEFWYQGGPAGSPATTPVVASNPLTCPNPCLCDMTDQACLNGTVLGISFALIPNCATPTNDICDWVIVLNGPSGQCLKASTSTAGCNTGGAGTVIPVGGTYPFPGDLGLFVTCGACPSALQLAALGQCYCQQCTNPTAGDPGAVVVGRRKRSSFFDAIMHHQQHSEDPDDDAPIGDDAPQNLLHRVERSPKRRVGGGGGGRGRWPSAQAGFGSPGGGTFGGGKCNKFGGCKSG